MSSQINYYNHFGEQYAESILNCYEPEYWTTDYDQKGRIYKEMKVRVDWQNELVHEFFRKDQPVLDIGCGFGRQAFLLAKKGFTVTATDTSNVFIDIAKKLFAKHNYIGSFECIDLLQKSLNQKFSQVILLDVLEHIKPSQRRKFWNRLSDIVNISGGLIILSLPHIKKRLRSKINNRIRRSLTQYFSYFLNKEEHPYPIPERKEILKLSSHSFSLFKFIETGATDYYVFRKN